MDNTKKDIAQGYAYYVDDEESVPGETNSTLFNGKETSSFADVYIFWFLHTLCR